MKWVHHLFSGEDNESAHLAGVGKSDVDVAYPTEVVACAVSFGGIDWDDEVGLLV